MALNRIVHYVGVNGVVAQVRYEGHITGALVAGKTLKIETSPAGEELLAAQVPSGKKWDCRILVYVEESDA